MEYKVKIKKVINTQFTERSERLKIDIVTEMQLSELVSNFLSADFNKREKMLQL